MTKRNLHPEVILKLPNPVPALILYGRHVIFAMTNNPAFPNPTPTLAQVATHLDDLEAAETQAQTRAKGTAEARDAKKKVARDDLKGLGHYVQSIVNGAAPEDASAIVKSAGMYEKRASSYDKPFLSVRMGTAPNQVVLRVKAVKGAAYEFQHSADGGVTWVSAGVTRVARISILGLASLTTHLFRFRTTLGEVTGEWSQSISFLVH